MNKLNIFILFVQLTFTGLASAQNTIPNYDFENWTWIGGWYENPDGWTTNNAQLIAIEVGKDTNAYHGNYAMKLKNYNTYKAWAQVKFPITIYPISLIAYVKCNLVDTDTVSIQIKLSKNGITRDSGKWVGTSSLSNYTQINIPISQNFLTIDSALIEITGGNHLVNNQLGMGTEFWVDYLSLDSTTGIENIKKNESQFELYPNPTNQYAIIYFNGEKNSIVSINLYDIVGNKIYTICDGEISNAQLFIDFSALPNGIYFLKFKTDKQIEVIKLIKQ